jgi:hypothetical protein
VDAPTAKHAACRPPVTQRTDFYVHVTVQSGQAANEDWLSPSELAHGPRTTTCDIIHRLDLLPQTRLQMISFHYGNSVVTEGIQT